METSKQQEKSGAVKPSKPELSWEDEPYAVFYQALIPKVSQAEPHYYEEIAKLTTLPGEKIQQILEFRLQQSPQPPLLSGIKPGICFLCTSHFPVHKEPEPICLKCLQAIYTAALELEPSPSSPSEDANGAPVELDSTTTENNASEEQITLPLTQYLAMQEELAAYAQKFGPLSIDRDSQQRPHQTEGSIPSSAKANEDDTEQLLSLLHVEDRQLKENITDLHRFIQGLEAEENLHQPLRHFGFQRPKSY